MSESPQAYNKLMIDEAILEAVIFDMLSSFKTSDGKFSKTRDVFTARLQSYILETKKYLEAAVIGEIGNNTFDHNFIFTENYPRGVYCDLSFRERYIVLADYGKGIRQSLLAVVPLGSDPEAVKTAFTKRISGRSPEQRGNGLKFVSETIQQNHWHLYFQSGSGSCSIDGSGIGFYEKSPSVAGCLAILDFDEEN